jgi:hypothetical protein
MYKVTLIVKIENKFIMKEIMCDEVVCGNGCVITKKNGVGGKIDEINMFPLDKVYQVYGKWEEEVGKSFSVN